MANVGTDQIIVLPGGPNHTFHPLGGLVLVTNSNLNYKFPPEHSCVIRFYCFEALCHIRFHMKRLFHTSMGLHQKPQHPLYEKIDWDQVASGKYAVVVSDFPGIVMYYTQKEFNLLIITWKQKDSSVQILAVPNSTPESK